MNQSYDLDANGEHLLATLEGPGQEEDAQPPKEEHVTIHVYPVAGGGILFSKVPLDQEEPTIVDSEEDPDTEIPLTRHPTTSAKELPFFFSFLLILGFFVLFDMADSQLTTLLTPTITVTITPKAQTITTTEMVPLKPEGRSNGVPGRVLPVFTLTQMQPTQATGHGHQNAKHATGTLIFYNGLFTAQFVPGGTLFTGRDGVQVTTSASVTIPAANPPQFAEVSVSASTTRAGAAGNIAAGDINTTIANGVLVKNSPFAGGQDARDFPLVTRDDIQRVQASLTPHLLQSEQAVLTSQLAASEALVPPTCTSTTTADHGPGSEALTVTISVSASCIAVAYNQQAVQVQALQLLTSMAATQLGTAYHLTGSIHVTVKQATATKTPIVLSVSLQGTWAYTLTLQEQQHIKRLIASRTKHQALQLLLSQQGIASATIAGVSDNQQLPQDLTHIQLLIITEE